MKTSGMVFEVIRTISIFYEKIVGIKRLRKQKSTNKITIREHPTTEAIIFAHTKTSKRVKVVCF